MYDSYKVKKIKTSNQEFTKYKWMTLLGFGILYNFVYVGRFNIAEQTELLANNLSVPNNIEDIIRISVFLSYAVGSMINGILCDKYSGKKMMIIGIIMSICINVITVGLSSWKSIVILQVLNGLFQSMIWLGGITVLSHWWKPGERGKGVGIANLFSGMSHITAYLLPLAIIPLLDKVSWESQVLLPIYVWAVFLLLFYQTIKNDPAEVKLEPYKLEDKEAKKERKVEKNFLENKSYKKLFKENPEFFVWCAIAFLSSMCRYGLLNWIPEYFHADTGKVIINDDFLNLILPIGMALGTFIITWVGGDKFNKNKGLVIVWAASLCGTLLIVFPMINTSTPVLMGVFFSGFFLYGINGMLWIYAIDAGCRYYSGTIAGFLNGFAYLGATCEAFIFPAFIKFTNNMLIVFIVMEILCIGIIICGIVISKKNTIVEPEVRE